jgi:hypothetical protein
LGFDISSFSSIGGRYLNREDKAEAGHGKSIYVEKKTLTSNDL